MTFFRAVFAVLLVGVALSGCTKCAPKDVVEKVTKTEEPVALETIGNTLAPFICEKYASCNQNPEFNKDQCVKEIATGIADNLKQTADLKVDPAKLDVCVKAVKDSPCEALNSATPPTGCEFLQ